MDTRELAREFVTGAPGMCERGRDGLMGSASVPDMVAEYWRGIDYCLARDYPGLRALAMFRDEFRDQHIYMDEEVKVRNVNRAAFLGGCVAEFTADGYAVTRLYVKHGGRVTVKASGNAYVMVDALDDARVSVEVSGQARVTVNLYARARGPRWYLKTVRPMIYKLDGADIASLGALVISTGEATALRGSSTCPNVRARPSVTGARGSSPMWIGRYLDRLP